MIVTYHDIQQKILDMIRSCSKFVVYHDLLYGWSTCVVNMCCINFGDILTCCD